LPKQEVNVISVEHNIPEKKHQKHTALKKPSVGHFGRNEWAILGGPCTIIKLLADQVIGALSADYKCAYIDTTHNDDLIVSPGRLVSGAALDFTDQVNYTQLNYNKTFTAFEQKAAFSDADIVIANGNHHQAKAQIVIIHENKRASLQKRVEKLDNVQMILLADNVTDVFDFIKEAVPDWDSLPVYRLDESAKIISWFKSQMLLAKPKLNGLVLAGGKSERMGHDKSLFNWHGKEQRYYMADMLKPLCDEVFISCRADQQQQINSNYPALPDTFGGLGPYGAILSAFREQPDSAWLVIASDLPLLTEKSLGFLVHNRNVSTIATAFKSDFDDFPEPLITIWEPKSYSVLLAFLAQGYSCPRKVLINNNINLLEAPDPAELTNVNTPEELEKVKTALQQN